jgi:hypothetical protein
MANSTQLSGATTYQVLQQFVGKDGEGPAVFLVPPYTGSSQPKFYPDIQLPADSFLLTGAPPKPIEYQYPPGGFTPDFGLTAQDGSSPSLQVTLFGNGNLWNVSPNSRATLMSNFSQFCQQVEQQFELSVSPPPILIPGATALIAQQMAELIPAPPMETLFYRFGLVTGTANLPLPPPPSINLLPGMRLRVEFENRQFVSSTGSTSAYNVYVPSGTSYYQVCSVPGGPGGLRSLAFDAFLGSIVAPNLTTAPSPAQALLASGLIDLQLSYVTHNYWKLVYPTSVMPGSNPGDTTTTDNVTLFGADSLQALAAGPSTSNGTEIVFQGRTTIVPEIPIVLSNTLPAPSKGTAPPAPLTQMIYVPVGTTLANLLDRFTSWQPFNSSQSVIALNRLQTMSMNQSVGYTVVLLNGPSSQPNSLGAFDLPLVRGDSVTLSFTT